jgi:hypothetical protein
MHSIVARLVLWVAEILDRNLVTVPDLDDWQMSYFTTTEGQAHDR